MPNGSTTTTESAEGHTDFKFLAHVQSLPLVTDSLDQIYSYSIGRNAAETIRTVGTTALKYSGPINPYLQKADSLADDGLKNFESRFPLVKAPSSEIREKTSGAAKTTVDTYVGAFQDKFSGSAGKVKADGQAAAEDVSGQTKEIKHSLQDSIDPYTKPILDKVEDLLDTYLPKAQDKLNKAKKDANGSAKSVKEDAADGAPELKAKADHTVQRVFQLSTSMVDRSSNAAKSVYKHGVDRVAGVTGTATEYAQYAIQNPGKVPEAAVSRARASSATVADTLNGTIELTRSTAQSLSDAAQQAQGVAFDVFQSEREAAPKDQPRGLAITLVNTALVLTGKTLDQAKAYLQQHGTDPSEVKDKIDAAGDSAKDAAQDATSQIGEHLPEEVDVKRTVKHSQDKVTNGVKHATKSVEEILAEEHK